MPSTPLTLLIDTNVWLDVFLPSRPEAEAARTLLEEAEKRGFSLVYAAQSSLDVYQRVIINNKRWVRESSALTEAWATAIRRWAWDAVTSMQELAVAVPVDMSDIWLACKYRYYHDDYEDDLVLAACRRSHADYLVTNDRKLLAHADVCAKTPRQMVELFKVLA